MLLTGMLVAWALAVAAFDIAQRRVPNLLLAALLVPAVVTLLSVHHGLLGAGITQSLIGLGIGAAPLLAGHLMRQVGAGDVKLAAVQGLVLGAAGMIGALLIAGLVLGLMSAVAVVRKRMGRPLKVRLPAAPALVVGFVAVVLELQLQLQLH
jgi:Flp pilus assembly protein protease CpaA